MLLAHRALGIPFHRPLPAHSVGRRSPPWLHLRDACEVAKEDHAGISWPTVGSGPAARRCGVCFANPCLFLRHRQSVTGGTSFGRREGQEVCTLPRSLLPFMSTASVCGLPPKEANPLVLPDPCGLRPNANLGVENARLPRKLVTKHTTDFQCMRRCGTRCG